MTQLRNPLMDTGDAGDKVHLGLLERRVILLTTMEVRLRAALELATGVPWDSENIIDLSADGLENVVAENMSRGLGISKMEALKRVRQNKITASPTDI